MLLSHISFVQKDEYCGNSFFFLMLSPIWNSPPELLFLVSILSLTGLFCQEVL